MKLLKVNGIWGEREEKDGENEVTDLNIKREY